MAYYFSSNHIILGCASINGMQSILIYFLFRQENHENIPELPQTDSQWNVAFVQIIGTYESLWRDIKCTEKKNVSPCCLPVDRGADCMR